MTSCDAVAEGLPGGAPVDLVEVLADRVLARPEVLALPSTGRGGELRHTTEDLLAVERGLLELTTSQRGAGRTQVDESTVARALASFPLLADEQVAMVRRLTTSGDGAELVVGQAGTGKTLALAAARQAWEESGARVFGAALSARAARGLQEGSGIGSDTLARVLATISTGELDLRPHDVVVVDEAGMVGTRNLAALIRATHRVGAKAVLVGDPHQLPEIEAGGAFAALASTRLRVSRLTQNRRQVNEWERGALAELRAGHAGLAVATYDRAGRVHVAPTLAEARHDLVESWLRARRAGEDAIMLAVTRHDVAELNVRARAALREGGSSDPTS